MEENKNFWSKTTDELTVAEFLLVHLAAPIVMIGGVVITGTIYGVSKNTVAKIRKVHENRKNKTTEK